MTADAPHTPFSDALGRATNRDRWLPWALLACSLAGIAGLAAFLWTSSRELASIRKSTDELRQAVSQRELDIQELRSDARRAADAVSTATATLGQSKKDIEAATGETRRMRDDLASARAAVAAASQDIARIQEQQSDRTQQAAQLERVLAALQEELETARATTEKVRGQLEDIEAKAKHDISAIRRELTTGHYVLKSRTPNEIAGLGIFIRFKPPDDKRYRSVADLCVSLEKRGPCVDGGPTRLLALGRTLPLDVNGCRYLITPTYYVRNRLFKDNVGFGILREKADAPAAGAGAAAFQPMR